MKVNKMKAKSTGLLLAVAMLVGMIAVPVAASTPTVVDAGVFSGTASVGKSTNCTNAGGNVSGGGLGISPFNDILTPKNAHWAINAANSVQSLGHGLDGDLSLCGDLGPRVIAGQSLGASCEVTKGTNGQGKATFDNGDVVYITDLGWTTTAGGTFVVTGKAGGAKGKADGLLVAVVEALDELVVVGCTTKSGSGSSKTGGAQVFNVVAAYAITPIGAQADDEIDGLNDELK